MQNHLLLRAAQNQKCERTPIWIMRQAGRYLPEYRKLRQKVSFMELCKTPELAVEASLMPIQRFELDAAIIFSDILLPIEAMGCAVEFTDQGPTINQPTVTKELIDRLTVANPEEKMPFVLEAIRHLYNDIGERLPVIGFAGAPFTLAAYMVEGRPSHSMSRIREFVYQEPKLYDQLATKIAHTVAAHLQAQVNAGAAIVQLFDTWAGVLSEVEYIRFALPYERLALKPLFAQKALTIVYIHGGSHLLPLMGETGAQVLSLDWRTNLAQAKKLYQNQRVLQGNLNPALLFATDLKEIDNAAREILQCFPERRGHIFSLGHGIHPNTPIENVKRLIEVVQAHHG